MTRKTEIRKTLSDYVMYDEAVNLRDELKGLALIEYQPRHTDLEYLTFIRSNAGEFTLRDVTPQDTNCLYAYTLFTVKSQQVFGDCLEECIDNAIDAIKL